MLPLLESNTKTYCFCWNFNCGTCLG